MAPLVLVMGLGPITRWKSDSAATLLRRVRWALTAALAAELLTGWLAGRIALVTTGGLTMAYWIVATLLVDLKARLWPAGGRIAQIPERARLLPRAMVGMLIAHLGVAAFAFGVSMVKTYQSERDVKMGPGDTTEIAGYAFRMLGVRQIQGPNYIAAEGTIEVTRGGSTLATLHPQKRVYRVQQNPMTEAAVSSNPLRDLYVSMGEQLPGGEWVVRVQYKPFIVWIWGGCLIMMAGGVLAASDRRYGAKKAVAAALPAASGAAA
jgi:cytochrome c-type biogenesis protein CcmF